MKLKLLRADEVHVGMYVPTSAGYKAVAKVENNWTHTAGGQTTMTTHDGYVVAVTAGALIPVGVPDAQ